MIYSKNCILFLIISFLLLVAVIGMGRKPPKMQKYPDFSTPEKTVLTLYKALKEKDYKVAQKCYIPKIDNFGTDFIKFSIFEKINIIKDSEIEKIGDVEIITKKYFKDSPPLKISYLLRKINNEWKIVDSIYIPDKNYPPEDQPDY